MVRRTVSPEPHQAPLDDRSARHSELVLAPNEYAYVLDTTKGHINCYVGPNKTSLAQTDQPVIYRPQTRRFESAELPDALQLFATAPCNWYMLLENPAQDELHPSRGVSNGLAELRVGEKVNVFGPATFPLWPGQTVQVHQGHALRSNQFIKVRVYDAAVAQASLKSEAELVAGQVLIVKGTETTFYMPPTGLEVIADQEGRYVRDAVTLHRLQYCILVGEDGTKRYVRGEAVVFPEVNDVFAEEDGQMAFDAIELSEIAGLYIKVIAPYTDDDEVRHEEGEEIFLTGRSRIYFPRQEHALMRQEGQLIHQAVAIPRGEGRYVLDRLRGAVSLVVGPRMYLPDPRSEVLIRRVLTEKEVRLLGREGMSRAGVCAKLELTSVESQGATLALDTLERGAYRPPRSVTLGGDDLAALRVEVRSGFAIQIVDRVNQRRVIQGPASVLLEYDETLQPLSLSTGTPKSELTKLETAFLRTAANEVSDRITVTTEDMVRAEITVKHRVRFEGEVPDLWFAVENYVQLLCDHTRSLVAARARQVPIQELRAQVADLVRDAVLGAADSDRNRPGRSFEDNAMRIVDVEVLDLRIDDEAVDSLLQQAQMNAIRSAVSAAEREAALSSDRRVQQVERTLAQERHETDRLRLELLAAHEADKHGLETVRAQAKAELQQLQRARELEDAARKVAVRGRELQGEAEVQKQEITRQEELQRLELERTGAQVQAAVAQAQAFSPHLVASLDRLSDQRMLATLAEGFSELAAVEGRGLLETARKYLDFVPAGIMPTLGPRESEGTDS